MSFFTMIKFAAIVSLAAIMSGPAETAALNCRSDKFLNRKLGEWKRSVSFPLIHIYSECSPFRPPNRTWESLMSETIRFDASRLLHLKQSMSTSRSSKVDQEMEVSVPVDPAGYLIQVDFGTPKQRMYTLIDTGSDVAWIPCKQCLDCDSTKASPFDPAMSSSYKALDCDSQACQQGNQSAYTSCGQNSECEFVIAYGDASNPAGLVGGPLSSDAITLGSQYLPTFSFGCAEKVRGETTSTPGLMGLGGGPLSLLNQPTGEVFGGTFSYCLPILASSGSGSLVLGKEAALSTSGLQFTKLLKNPSTPTFYYVNLIGISVGNTTVPVPATSIGSGGGTIIDSGTTISALVDSAYTSLRDAFREQIPDMQAKSHNSLDTCYDMSASSVDVPTITLHLDGNVDLVLPEENILFKPQSGLVCLAFRSSGNSNPLSIIGNVQQQNWRVVFDVPNSRVGFAQERCAAA